MRNRSILALGALMAGGMMVNPNYGPTRLRDFTPAPTKLNNDKINRAKGLKKYWFGDNFVWALNEKNAKRKAKKQNYTIPPKGIIIE